MSGKCHLGLVGLAVMGENLALNMLDNGWSVAVFNRTLSKVDDFIARAAAEGHSVCGCRSLEELVGQLETPRRVMFMIKSADPVPADEGLFPEISPVDSVIAQLCELLSPGDVIIDGGNTHFRDTERRQRFVEARGLLYIGTGVSGGEAGARRGPSIMPGGSDKAWPLVRPIFETIAAMAGADGTEPCVDWIGPRGAGHYVKMVHNGIEYGNMQLISEAYWLLKHVLKMGNEEIGQVFAAWNRGSLQGYLMEITRDIFTVRDSNTGDYLIDRILDRAGAKGTGKWTGQSSFDLGIPVTLITSAVNARNLSAQKELRVAAGSELEGPHVQFPRNREAILRSLEIALHLSILSSYTQGFAQLSEASRQYGYRLDLSQIARVWRAGCIIRAAFLDDIAAAFGTDRRLENLLLAPIFKVVANRSHMALREVVTLAIESGLPVPGLSAALAYYDSLRSPNLPANLVQAQRDYFGSHRYQRVDKPEAETFHTEWQELRTVKPAAETGKETLSQRPKNLFDMKPSKDFLVCIDSDGCAFDTMEIKHKECFIPNTIHCWNLQAVSKYARETAEFVNLYSKSRGANRFPALIETLTLLSKRPEVKARGVHLTVPESLMEWIDGATKLGEPELEKAVVETSAPALVQTLEWSRRVNESIERIVRGVPPFAYVRESLQRLSEIADVIVVSATPQEALEREWDEHDLTQYVRGICGQQVGTKEELLQIAARYPANHALMIGDAPGDFAAAQPNGALFYPIKPGAEEASWKRFSREAVDRFVERRFAGQYQRTLLDEFDACLPQDPAWPLKI